MVNQLPSQEYLKECFTYDPETGLLYWKERPLKHFINCKFPVRECKRWNGRYSHKQALGSVHPKGYKHGVLQNKTVKAHRVIYKLIHGVDPEEIDHIDGNSSNNRIENLRSVSHAENMKNQKTPITNSTGHIGISFYKASGKWMASIGDSGESIFLGYFDNIENAITARRNKEIELEFHNNHGR